MHLRRHRAEELLGGADRGHAGSAPGARVHRRGGRLRRGPRSLQVSGALRRLRHGPALDGERRARAHRLRRPLQAGGGLPLRLAPAPAPTGPRGVPRGRLLPALAPARAGGEALRRARWRVDDRAADHRDQGRRHLGLHPDQRDLHHRRPGLLGDRPVQLGYPARHQRRQLGQPGGECRPGQGDEAGVGHAQARPGAVPGARVVRHLRLGARPRARRPSSTAATG